jgi:hypothetical protein
LVSNPRIARQVLTRKAPNLCGQAQARRHSTRSFEEPMRTITTSLLSIGVLVALGGSSLAHGRHVDNSPSAIAARQRDARTFDPTQYFEHDSRKIPIGTLEWWNQKAREGH